LLVRQRRRQVVEIMRRVAASRCPRVLVGDLNTGWKHLDMDALATNGLRPVCAHQPQTYSSTRPRYCLDHIFASPEFRCTAVRTIPSTASDHLPLYADLELVAEHPHRESRHAAAPAAARAPA